MRRGRDGKETGCRDWRLEREEWEGFVGKHFVAGNVFCQDTLCGKRFVGKHFVAGNVFCQDTLCGKRFVGKHFGAGNVSCQDTLCGKTTSGETLISNIYKFEKNRSMMRCFLMIIFVNNNFG